MHIFAFVWFTVATVVNVGMFVRHVKVMGYYRRDIALVVLMEAGLFIAFYAMMLV